MHEVLVNRLGGLSLPRKSVVRLTDCPDMTLDVYRGRKTTTILSCIQVVMVCKNCEDKFTINEFVEKTADSADHDQTAAKGSVISVYPSQILPEEAV